MQRIKNYFSITFLTFVFIFAFAQCVNTVDQELKKTAEFANKSCPRAVDDYTRLDSVNAIHGEIYRFNYTILGNLTFEQVSVVKKSLPTEIIKNIQIDPSMKFFRENNVTLEYYYRALDNTDLFNIIVTPSEYKK